MIKLPSITAKTLERSLLKMGFERLRQKGSHVIYRHPDGRWTAVPVHQGCDLPMSFVREILREIGVTPEDFKNILDKH